MLLTKARSYTSIERAAKLKQCSDYGWVNRLITGKRDTIEELRSILHKEELDMPSQGAKRPKLMKTTSLDDLITENHAEGVQGMAEGEEEVEMASESSHSRYDLNHLITAAVDDATTTHEARTVLQCSNSSYEARLDLAELLRGRDVSQACNPKAWTPHQSFSHPFIS